MMFGTREEFQYFKCNDCGCLQITEFPSNPSQYYPKTYYSFNIQSRNKQETPPIEKILQKWCTRQMIFDRGHKLSKLARLLVSPSISTRRIGPILKRCAIKSFNSEFLDIGCGSSSWWLSELNSMGFTNLLGIDPYIEGNTQADHIRIEKLSVDKVSGKFDLVTMHHSLEHIEDQTETLESIRRILTPNGCCLIRIPLVSSCVWKTYGIDWVELDAPRHYYLHSLESIKLLGEKAGLELFHTEWDSTEFEFWGSEQYKRGIPLMAENSFLTSPDNSEFTYREMGRFRNLAEQANREGLGGRGIFYFRTAKK